jgi:hypothetical protein
LESNLRISLLLFIPDPPHLHLRLKGLLGFLSHPTDYSIANLDFAFYSMMRTIDSRKQVTPLKAVAWFAYEIVQGLDADSLGLLKIGLFIGLSG